MLAGLTETELPVTVPILGLMLRLEAPVTVHDRLVEAPLEIDDGFAVKLLITGSALGGFTVMVTSAFVEPLLFEAVSV